MVHICVEWQGNHWYNNVYCAQNHYRYIYLLYHIIYIYRGWGCYFNILYTDVYFPVMNIQGSQNTNGIITYTHKCKRYQWWYIDGGSPGKPKLIELATVGMINCSQDMANQEGAVTGGFPSQKAGNTENVFIWWRHHDMSVWPRHWQRHKLELAMFCSCGCPDKAWARAISVHRGR